MKKTRIGAIILLLVAAVLYPTLKLLDGKVVDGVYYQSAAADYSQMILSNILLFLISFGLISLIWPKGRLLIRVILGILLIYPVLFLLIMLGGLF